jgi:hypothetical protein
LKKKYRKQQAVIDRALEVPFCPLRTMHPRSIATAFNSCIRARTEIAQRKGSGGDAAAR